MKKKGYKMIVIMMIGKIMNSMICYIGEPMGCTMGGVPNSNSGLT